LATCTSCNGPFSVGVPGSPPIPAWLWRASVGDRPNQRSEWRLRVLYRIWVGSSAQGRTEQAIRHGGGGRAGAESNRWWCCDRVAGPTLMRRTARQATQLPVAPSPK
jgi:hypothetical protein